MTLSLPVIFIIVLLLFIIGGAVAFVAFQKDASLKERALKDLEFSKLVNKSTFQSLF